MSPVPLPCMCAMEKGCVALTDQGNTPNAFPLCTRHTAAQTAPNHAVLAAQKRTRTARQNRTARAPEPRSERAANARPAGLRVDSELTGADCAFEHAFLMQLHAS